MTLAAGDLKLFTDLDLVAPALSDQIFLYRSGFKRGTLTALNALIGGGGGGSGESAFDTPEANGAVGDGLTDDTVALQAWLDSANPLKAASGTYAIKGADGASGALTLSRSGVTMIGGTFVPIANTSGHAPGICINVTGARNTLIGAECWNSGDLGKATSDGGNEYPMEGIRLTGIGNTAQSCRAWNFVTPFRATGPGINASDCHFLQCFATVKDVANLAYSNDGILFTYADRCSAVRCHVGMATSALARTITYESVTGASTSTLRCGITADATTSNISMLDNVVGEGFIVGLDHEGIGDRRNTVRGNYVYKQQRNAISPAGGKFLIEGNWLLGTFNTESSSTTGIIGGVSDDTIIRGNFIYCDTASIEGIKCVANTSNVLVHDNQFIGTFKVCVAGICNAWNIHGNILNGSAIRFADLDRIAAVTKSSSLKVHDNIINGVTTQGVRATSGFLSADIHGNKIVLLEGYAAADGVIEVGGGGAGIVGTVGFRVHNNECVYVGTTSVTGTKGFFKSSATGATGLVGYVRDNTFPTAIFNQAAVGLFLTGLVQISGNSSNTGDAGTLTGSFTTTAVNDFAVANVAVLATSKVFLSPTNQAAGALQSGPKQLVHYDQVAGNAFYLKTADGNACAGGETFNYLIVNP